MTFVLEDLAETVLARARAAGKTLGVAESCTGGLVSAHLTAIAGSSDVFLGAIVSYANAAKANLLGVPNTMLDTHGAVSGPVAEAMARGAQERLGADLAVSITGIAGPGGGTADKPVGLVWFGLAVRDGDVISREHRFGDLSRTGVRNASVATALELMLGAL